MTESGQMDEERTEGSRKKEENCRKKNNQKISQ